MDFGRVLTAMITPMYQDGRINYAESRRLAEYLLDNGSDALVVAATTGEGATMEDDEKLKLFAEISQVAHERNAAVLAGTGSNNTAHVVELSKKAEALGVDGVLVVAPYYNKPTQDGMLAHFGAVADAVSVPVMLYNVPGRTGSDIKTETVAELANTKKNIVALKDASGDVARMAKLNRLVSPEFMVYSGEDNLILPMLSMGACGVVSVCSHLIGNVLNELITAWDKGETDKAAELQSYCDVVFSKMFMTTSPLPVKYAMGRLGFEVGPCRLPLTWVTKEQAAEIDAMMAQIGLI